MKTCITSSPINKSTVLSCINHVVVMYEKQKTVFFSVKRFSIEKILLQIDHFLEEVSASNSIHNPHNGDEDY